jgi:hypothetical protein
MSETPPVEIEAKLVVASEHRREIVRALQELRALGSYRLVHRPPREIHDRYFDTGEEDLRRLDLSCRIRSVDDRMLVTVKGPTEYLRSGALARSELELAWSASALETVVNRLREQGVALADGASTEHRTPELSLEAVGLRRIHQRTVLRTVRDAIERSAPDGPTVAEIVFDAVSYDIAGKPVLHDEIEVEGIGPNGAEHVHVLVRALHDRFGEGLRSWRPSKLALGLMLDRLHRSGALPTFVDVDNRLSSDGYDEVIRRLRTG